MKEAKVKVSLGDFALWMENPVCSEGFIRARQLWAVAQGSRACELFLELLES